jgi:hypothetical protein
MRTYAYIDGFNLYYGAVRRTPYKWLDLKALVERIFPRNHLARVKYFTARVQPPPWDPGKPQRQDAYLRALRAYRADFDI